MESVHDVLLNALNFAAARHRDQRRKDTPRSPYINHPIAVAHLLARIGVSDPKILCAAVLHDTIEDTATTFQELERGFGLHVACLVRELSDDKTQDKATRKRLVIEHAPGLSSDAKLIKQADLICNLQDLIDSPPEDWPLARKQDYFDWASLVAASLRGHHQGLDIELDRALARRDQLA